MKRFDLLLRFPTGGVLVGGYSAIPDGMHATHASDNHQRPLIPATALRGALRETLEALLRGAGEPACSGGDGVAPTRDAQTAAAVPCTLDGGNRCKACRVFGTRREVLGSGERGFSAVLLGAAHAEGAVGWSVRPGVGIERHKRSAGDKRLFMQRVPALPDQRFVAQGRLLEPALEAYLSAAVRATKHIGAGRSRGLARVEMELVWHEAAAKSPVTLPADGDIQVRVKLLAPASIGAPVVHQNLRATREEIPGAALRGAIGFALAEVLDNPDGDESFNALVAEDGASFGFLYPVDAEAPAAGPSGPLPITASACKRHGREHGVVDTLLDRLAVSLIAGTDQVGAVERGTLSECRCGQPLRALSGWRKRTAAIPTRTVTRAAMDRRQASARNEQLFTQVLIEEGTVFEGVIRNAPERGRAHLARALALPLSLGRGRASGWGRVEMEALEPVAHAPLAQRAAAFDGALRQRLEDVKLSMDLVGRLVPVTLLSPLVTEGDDKGEELLLRALEGTSCVLKARRFSREGGWDQRGGGMQPVLATAPGGVFVIDLGPGRTWRDVLLLLARLEQHGLGQRRHQGYGQVITFDPVFLQRSFPR